MSCVRPDLPPLASPESFYHIADLFKILDEHNLNVQQALKEDKVDLVGNIEKMLDQATPGDWRRFFEELASHYHMET